MTNDTLKLAAMAISAKIKKMEVCDKGTVGFAMKEDYKKALNEINSLIQ